MGFEAPTHLRGGCLRSHAAVINLRQQAGIGAEVEGSVGDLSYCDLQNTTREATDPGPMDPAVMGLAVAGQGSRAWKGKSC